MVTYSGGGRGGLGWVGEWKESPDQFFELDGGELGLCRDFLEGLDDLFGPGWLLGLGRPLGHLLFSLLPDLVDCPQGSVRLLLLELRLEVPRGSRGVLGGG